MEWFLYKFKLIVHTQSPRKLKSNYRKDITSESLCTSGHQRSTVNKSKYESWTLLFLDISASFVQSFIKFGPLMFLWKTKKTRAWVLPTEDIKTDWNWDKACIAHSNISDVKVCRTFTYPTDTVLILLI